ncbi:DUF2510 domain-containing protein [Streptomyces sp. NPDC019224]|uniref:DUF2510 domain-containing protein n=1 Tax=Streptomyces sp. NPDC019224 TaxID=3154484 RepID=UPI0033D373E1
MSCPTPPGRYPDTAAPGTERWWDGRAWTARTRAAPRPRSGPAAGSAERGRQRPGRRAPGGRSGRRRLRRDRSRAAHRERRTGAPADPRLAVTRAVRLRRGP